MKFKAGVFVLASALCAALFFSPVAAASNVVKVGSARTVQGGSISIPITLEANQGFSSLKIELSYDPNVLAIETTFAHLAGFDQRVINSSVKGTVVALLSGYDNGSRDYWSGYEIDKLFTINFKVLNDAPNGDSKISVVSAEAVNVNLKEVALDISNAAGAVTVASSHYGDVNCDDIVDIRDVTLFAQYLADYYGDLSKAADPAQVKLPDNGGYSKFSYSETDAYQVGTEKGLVNLKDLLTLFQFVSNSAGVDSLPVKSPIIAPTQTSILVNKIPLS